jgi:hypothetical protein
MNNVQAFPVFEAKRVDADFDLTDPGMTLRDYFAGQALAGLLAYYNSISREATRNRSIEDVIAESSYKYADAILEARDKK